MSPTRALPGPGIAAWGLPMGTEGISSSEFESSIRQNRELMPQMAERERFDVDPRWVRITKGTMQALMYLIAFGVVAFAVWMVASTSFTG